MHTNQNVQISSPISKEEANHQGNREQTKAHLLAIERTNEARGHMRAHLTLQIDGANSEGSSKSPGQARKPKKIQ